MVLIYISAYASIRTIALNYGIKPVICVFNKAMVLYKETKKSYDAVRLKIWVMRSQEEFFLSVQSSPIQFNCYRERGERVLEERLAGDHAADTEAPARGHGTAEDWELQHNTLKRSHGFPPSQLSKSLFWRAHSVSGTNNMMSYSFLFLRLRRFIG